MSPNLSPPQNSMQALEIIKESENHIGGERDKLVHLSIDFCNRLKFKGKRQLFMVATFLVTLCHRGKNS